jgi:CheY-like chemotaxis protein
MPKVRKPVLVVDDHDDSRAAVCSLLRDAGFAVIDAANGKEALVLLVSEDQPEPCLIVLDLDMPVMSGWEFLAIAKSYYRLSLIPFVVLAESPKQSEAVKHGAVVGYFPKPVDLDLLVAKVRGATARALLSPRVGQGKKRTAARPTHCSAVTSPP